MGLVIKITTALTFIFSLSFGLICLLRKNKSKVIVLWSITSITVAIWSFGYLLSVNSLDNENAFKFLRIVYFGATLIPIFYFHFISSFLFLDKKFKNLIILGYILALSFLILVEFSRFIISGARYMNNFGRYEEVTTFGFKFFLIYFLFYSFFGLYLLVVNYRSNGGIRKKQIAYLIIASLFGFIGGISNFLADLTGIYPYGQMFVWLYPVLITYGIFL